RAPARRRGSRLRAPPDVLTLRRRTRAEKDPKWTHFGSPKWVHFGKTRLGAGLASAVQRCSGHDADNSEDDLDKELDPVPSVGVVERPDDGGPDECGGDADPDGQPDRDGLPARREGASDDAQDEPDDD